MIEGNFECQDIFKTRPGLVVKNVTLGLPVGNQTRDFGNLANVMLCQLRYGGRCRELGHEFSLYIVVMRMSRRVYLYGHCGIYTRLTVKFTTLLMEENLECEDIFKFFKTF